MSSIPSNLARVPMSLTSSVTLNNLSRTNVSLLNAQVQLATNRRINRVSDDVAGASIVLSIEQSLERRTQQASNMQRGTGMLNTIDQLLAEATDLALEAKGIAAEMVGSIIDDQTRESHAEVIGQLLDQAFRIANESLNGVHLFGGEYTALSPFQELLGGIRYTGGRDGMRLDLGSSDRIEVTLPGHEAFGALSARVEGDHDLDPALTPETRIADLFGARGQGVTLGEVQVDLNGVETVTLDLSQAESMQDVIDLIDDVISDCESEFGLNLLGVPRVTVDSSGRGLMINALPGVTITFSDIGSGVTAADLGLSQSPFTDADPVGEDLDPKVTWFTSLSGLAGVSGTLDDFTITNAGQTRTIAASTASTLDELRALIDQADIGVRLEIGDDGRTVNLINELSGGAMSVAETAGGQGATLLGIRTFTTSTRLEDFNNGRGVHILSGSVDPITGDPDPSRDLDFRVTLSDGSSFDVDLAGAETVDDVLTIVQAAAPPTFSIGLATEGNGFVLTDSSGGTGAFSVTALNGSRAAEDLGILGSTSGATLAGEDRAMVEVDGLFAHLSALRQALLDNNTAGITFAGEKLQADIDRLAQARARVGQSANRIASLQEQEEERRLLDLSLKSQLQDLDFTEATVRFNQLQVQLQAATIAGARAGQMSLLNYLG